MRDGVALLGITDQLPRWTPQLRTICGGWDRAALSGCIAANDECRTHSALWLAVLFGEAHDRRVRQDRRCARLDRSEGCAFVSVAARRDDRFFRLVLTRIRSQDNLVLLAVLVQVRLREVEMALDLCPCLLSWRRHILRHRAQT